MERMFSGNKNLSFGLLFSNYTPCYALATLLIVYALFSSYEDMMMVFLCFVGTDYEILCELVKMYYWEFIAHIITVIAAIMVSTP
jgi:hypothetical protein